MKNDPTPTPLDLEAIEARLKEAKEGPWKSDATWVMLSTLKAILADGPALIAEVRRLRTESPAPAADLDQRQPADVSLAGKRMHRLKCRPKPFAALLAGDKTFEWRKFDRDYQVGDVLILNEWDGEYSGTCVHREVTYLISEGFGIPAGYCIMGIKPYPPAAPALTSEVREAAVDRFGRAIVAYNAKIYRNQSTSEREETSAEWAELMTARSALLSPQVSTPPAPLTEGARVKELEGLLRRGQKEMVWCSGSGDFAPEGQARIGWLKGPAQWLHDVTEVLSTQRRPAPVASPVPPVTPGIPGEGERA